VVDAEIENFIAKLPSLRDNTDVKSAASGLKRDLVVIAKISKYDAKNDRFLTKYDNVNVIVGKQNEIDKIKPFLDDFISGLAGTFKRTDRF